MGKTYRHEDEGILRVWRKGDRHTGRERKITMRESDLVGMNRWLRDMEIKAVPSDGERRSKDDRHGYPTAA